MLSVGEKRDKRRNDSIASKATTSHRVFFANTPSETDFEKE
jgi:hypothetical protein